MVQVKLNGTEYFRKSISAAKQIDAQVSALIKKNKTFLFARNMVWCYKDFTVGSFSHVSPFNRYAIILYDHFYKVCEVLI